MTVVPGPRVEVRNVSLDAATPLAPKTPSRDEPWSDRLDHLRKIWPLPPGKPFREADWSGGKTATLGALRADGYPKANWQSTRARIDATDNVADLELVAESGPLYHLGEIRVDGVSVFDEVSVRRMATFFRGQVYSERLLLDYQDRLIKLGLFEGASVELDATGPPEGAPVLVKVKELTQYQANFGIGYSANTGPRASVELYDRRIFGAPWVAHAHAHLRPRPQAGRHRVHLVPAREPVAQPARRQRRGVALRRRDARQRHRARRPLAGHDPVRAPLLRRARQGAGRAARRSPRRATPSRPTTTGCCATSTTSCSRPTAWRCRCRAASATATAARSNRT